MSDSACISSKSMLEIAAFALPVFFDGRGSATKVPLLNNAYDSDAL